MTATALHPTIDPRSVVARPQRQEPALALFNGVLRCLEPFIGSLDDRASVANLPAPATFRFCDGDDFHLSLLAALRSQRLCDTLRHHARRAQDALRPPRLGVLTYAFAPCRSLFLPLPPGR